MKKEKAGIVMNAYKAPTFRENLKGAGYTWEEHPGVFKDTLIFTVDFEPGDGAKLHRIIDMSNKVSTRRN